MLPVHRLTLHIRGAALAYTTHVVPEVGHLPVGQQNLFVLWPVPIVQHTCPVGQQMSPHFTLGFGHSHLQLLGSKTSPLVHAARQVLGLAQKFGLAAGHSQAHLVGLSTLGAVHVGHV